MTYFSLYLPTVDWDTNYDERLHCLCAYASFVLQRLANIKANPSRFVSANLPVNKFKNRLVNILPCK